MWQNYNIFAPFCSTGTVFVETFTLYLAHISLTILRISSVFASFVTTIIPGPAPLRAVPKTLSLCLRLLIISSKPGTNFVLYG